MSKNKILVFVEWLLDLNFFSRFVKGLNECNCELIFLTNSLSLYLIGIRRGLKIFLCRKSHKKNDDESYLNSTEVLGNFLSKTDAEILFKSGLHSGEKIVKTHGIKLIFIGNGSSTAQIAMKTVAHNFNLPTLFFENPNVPGKTFIDKKGVNASSTLYENISILNDYSVNAKDYERFIREYLSSATVIAKKKKKILSIENPFIIFDYLGFLFFNLPKTQNFSLLDRIIRKFAYRSLKVEYDEISLQDKFIFYPLQVSSDSQLLVNSTISNIDALEFSCDLAQKKGLKLVVKSHPKEKGAEIIKKILALKRKKNFLLSDTPTLELVRNCEMLVTINSTVGLEGLILDKNVIFLGKTFYKDLNSELIPRYICGYLADFPYTSKDDISSERISEILKRIEFNSA